MGYQGLDPNEVSESKTIMRDGPRRYRCESVRPVRTFTSACGCASRSAVCHVCTRFRYAEHVHVTCCASVSAFNVTKETGLRSGRCRADGKHDTSTGSVVSTSESHPYCV
ncbi:uncharacterized [Tachysurus ichikawai]